MLIDHRKLRGIAADIFIACGSASEEADCVADHLVDANLAGHDSHGVGMIPHYVKNWRAGTVKPNSRGRIVGEPGAIIVYDGERGYGQVVARAATQFAIVEARAGGLALLALRNAHHIGRVGAYAELCAEAGLVGIFFVNVIGHPPIVAPHRGRDSRLMTNPVAIGVPAAEPGRPIILDMATSGIAMGKARVAMNKNAPLAPGLVIDAEGRPSTDGGVMFREPHGALLPLGEHKGYGLAFVCDLLAGAVAGGGTIRPENQNALTVTNSFLAIVLDPARITDSGWFAAEITALTRFVTASPPTDPALPVLIPGDPERIARAERIAQGIPVDPATWAELAEVARGLGLDIAA
jgi:uncharacterized oxidoreductase